MFKAKFVTRYLSASWEGFVGKSHYKIFSTWWFLIRTLGWTTYGGKKVSLAKQNLQAHLKFLKDGHIIGSGQNIGIEKSFTV